MSDLTIEIETDEESMSVVRPRLDAELRNEFSGGLLKWNWKGDELELTGPGAQGVIRLRDGLLVGEATLRPPASAMKPVIRKKISEALRKVAGNGAVDVLAVEEPAVEEPAVEEPAVEEPDRD